MVCELLPTDLPVGFALYIIFSMENKLLNQQKLCCITCDYHVRLCHVQPPLAGSVSWVGLCN